MSTTFIPGYLAEITIATVDYSVVGNVLGLSATKTTPRKPVFGQKAQGVISGQEAWSMSCGGHIAVEAPIADLLAAFSLATPVAFTIAVGETGGPGPDGGSFAGNMVLSAIDFTDDSEGEWEWSLSGEIDQAPVFTPPV